MAPTAMEKQKIAGAVAAFGLGRLQELVSLHRALEAAGVGVEALEAFLAEERRALVKRQEAEAAFLQAFEAGAMKCPECGAAMSLAPVNTGPRDRVGGPWKSQWICPRKDCMETVFNEERPEDILRGMGLAPPRRP